MHIGTSNPTRLALKRPLNSPACGACCLKLLLQNRSIEDQHHFYPGFEFGFYHVIFSFKGIFILIPSLWTDGLTFLRGNESQRRVCASPCVQGRGSYHPVSTYLIQEKLVPDTVAFLLPFHPGVMMNFLRMFGSYGHSPAKEVNFARVSRWLSPEVAAGPWGRSAERYLQREPQ